MHNNLKNLYDLRAARFARVLLMLAIPFVASACTTTNSDARLESGEISKKADGQNALSNAETRHLIETLQAQGDRALAVNDLEAAKSAFSQILQRDKKHEKAIIGMGETSLRGRDFARAAGYFSSAVASPNADTKSVALQGQGIALVKLGRAKDAEKVLRMAILLEPTLWRSWNALGRSLDKQRRFDQARESYEKALALNPDAAILFNNRGVSNLLAGRYVEAESDFVQAVSKDPSLERARGNLRLAFAWQGKYVQALSDLDHVGGPVVLNNVGYIAFKRGDYEKAEAYFVQAMQSSPAFYPKADRNLRMLKAARRVQNVAKSDK